MRRFLSPGKTKRILACLVAAVALALSLCPASAFAASSLRTEPTVGFMPGWYNAKVGEAYSYKAFTFADAGKTHHVKVTSTYYVDGEEVTIDGLPCGLKLTDDGYITGTPTEGLKDSIMLTFTVSWDGVSETKTFDHWVFYVLDRDNGTERIDVSKANVIDTALGNNVDVANVNDGTLIRFKAAKTNSYVVYSGCNIGVFDANGRDVLEPFGWPGSAEYGGWVKWCHLTPGATYYVRVKDTNRASSSYAPSNAPAHFVRINAPERIAQSSSDTSWNAALAPSKTNVTKTFSGDSNTVWDVYSLTSKRTFASYLGQWEGWYISAAITPFSVHFDNQNRTVDVSDLLYTAAYTTPDSSWLSKNPVTSGCKLTYLERNYYYANYKDADETTTTSELLYVPAGQKIHLDKYGIIRAGADSSKPAVSTGTTSLKTQSAAKISTSKKTVKGLKKGKLKATKTFSLKKAGILGNAKCIWAKTSGNSKIKVSANGKVTVKKGIKKGSYKLKVKLKIAATGTYTARTITKTVKVTIK